MLQTELKVEKRIAELKGFRFEGDPYRGYRYRDMRELGAFRMKEDNSGVANPKMPAWKKSDGWLDKGECWKGRDHYLWLEKKISLPEEWKELPKELKPIGYFDFGLTGGGYNSGVDAMLYRDGAV